MNAVILALIARVEVLHDAEKDSSETACGPHCLSCPVLREARAAVAATAESHITSGSLGLFFAYVKDAGNWGGTPLVGGNVGGSKEERGNLTQLKRAGLITTFKDEGHTWLQFTAAGRELAAQHGIIIEHYGG